MAGIHVYGPVEGMVLVGSDIRSLIGKPIRDDNGSQIGIIEYIDPISNEWHGTVFAEKDIMQMVTKTHSSSMELSE